MGDGFSLLLHLYSQGGGPPLPCSGATIQDGGNRLLLNINDDVVVDVSDAVFLLNFIFGAGPPPVPGLGCNAIEGCPEVCLF